MTTTLRRRKLVLTAHVTTSVGWLGAVAVFLSLAIIALTSQNAQTVRGAYLVMEPAAWFVLVPLAFASLLTGIVQSLGTRWGLFRHYWVLFKLVITVLATTVLLIYMKTFSYMADVAADPSIDLSVVQNASPVLHAMLALLALFATTALSVYKPQGMTPYGRRKQHEQHKASQRTPLRRRPTTLNRGDTRKPLVSRGDTVGGLEDASAASIPWERYMLLAIVGIVLLFAVLHLFVGNPGPH